MFKKAVQRLKHFAICEYMKASLQDTISKKGDPRNARNISHCYSVFVIERWYFFKDLFFGWLALNW